MAKRRASQTVVGTNIGRLIDHRGLSRTDAAKLLKVKPFQVDRLRQGLHAVTVRTLDDVATALGVEPYQLLIPGLEPGNPQILKLLTPSEVAFYKALEQVRKEPRG